MGLEMEGEGVGLMGSVIFAHFELSSHVISYANYAIMPQFSLFSGFNISSNFILLLGSKF